MKYVKVKMKADDESNLKKYLDTLKNRAYDNSGIILSAIEAAEELGKENLAHNLKNLLTLERKITSTILPKLK